MKAKTGVLTKKDLLAIRKTLSDKVDSIIKKLEETQEKNSVLLKENEKFIKRMEHITLKVEKVSLQNELLYATYLHAMELINIYKQKVLELEEQLKSTH